MLVEDLIQVRGELFEEVQSQKIFQDDKTFVDAHPKKEPEKILKLYQEQKNSKDFSLKAFVLDHFILPKESQQKKREATFSQALDTFWDDLIRSFPKESNFSTLVPLDHPHVVPGGRFREMYYWDSYFTIEGLLLSDRVDVVKNMVENLSSLIDHFGFVPNGNRFYYLTRSQQPFFSMILDVLHRENMQSYAQNFFPQLQREYSFWMGGESLLSAEKPQIKRVVRLSNGDILNRYFDELDHPRPEAFSKDQALMLEGSSQYKKNLYKNIRASCESGWDFSSRFCIEPKQLSSIATTSFLPIDLNCLLFHYENLIGKFAELSNKDNLSEEFYEKAKNRQNVINKLLFDETKGFFFDYNFEEKTLSKSFHLAGVYPLFFELCSTEQAEAVALVLKEKFLVEGGLLTTLERTNHQWDAPNVWAPLQLMAYFGLKNYGFNDLAFEVASRFTTLCEAVYNQTGEIYEKYNGVNLSSKVDKGEYQNQIGFGWTLGVLKVFQDEIKKRMKAQL